MHYRFPFCESVYYNLLYCAQVAEERLANMRTVQAFVQENREAAVYNKQVDDVLRLSYKESLARGLFWAMVSIAAVLQTNIFLYHKCQTSTQILIQKLFFAQTKQI